MRSLLPALKAGDELNSVKGGVAVIPISGNGAIGVADQIFSGPMHSYKTHTAHFGKVMDSESNVVDEAIALVMLSHRSYTEFTDQFIPSLNTAPHVKSPASILLVWDVRCLQWA